MEEWGPGEVKNKGRGGKGKGTVQLLYISTPGINLRFLYKLLLAFVIMNFILFFKVTTFDVVMQKCEL